MTVLIATGGHAAAGRQLAAKAPSVARSSAAILPLPMPRHVVPPRAAARPKHTPARHASEPPARPAISEPVNTAPQPSAPSATSGFSYWRQLAQRFGMTTWPSRMDPPERYRWP